MCPSCACLHAPKSHHFPTNQPTYHIPKPHQTNPTGSGDETLRHLRFSDEVKRTFLARWSTLPRPYIGFHIRSTDRSCPPEKFAAILQKQVQPLRRKKRLQGAPVYMATDNPRVPELFRGELEDVQGREIVSFTFHPPVPAPGPGAAAAPGGEEKGRKGRKRGKGEEVAEGGPVPLHLNQNLTPEEKHRTNIDGFVDLLLLAFSAKAITTCGGYTRLAKFLHKEQTTALSLIGEALEYEGQDPDEVLAAAWGRLQEEEGEGEPAM